MAYSSAVRDIVEVGDKGFSGRTTLLGLWQETAENFYPERADFITQRTLGADFLDGLMSSYPVMARRELGDLFGSFLRPRAVVWGELHAADEGRDKDSGARAWLEWATAVQWRATYDPDAMFVRATSEGDHDFATFGQCVLSVEPNQTRDALLYRNWHLRDCVWFESPSGKVDTMHRRWKPTLRNLNRLWPGKLSSSLLAALRDDPNQEIACRHIVVPSSDYAVPGAKNRNAPFSSLYIDEENETVLEEMPLGFFPYIVPRWRTVSGTQYARSPATEAVLPDARLLQAITRVLLEAGEKAVDPPMLAAAEALRSDINLLAGGVTTYDMDYDEKTGEVLRPVGDFGRGLPIGMEMANSIKETIKEGFFLNKLNLPEMRTMTAYETRKRIEEYVRASAPLFEPIEEQYNAAICNLTFDILMANGAFGPAQNIPPALLGADVRFTFKSPLREAAEEMNSQKLLEGMQLVTQAAAIDPAQIAQINITPAVQDALRGIGWKAAWINDLKVIAAKQDQIARQQQMQAGVGALGAGADIATKVGQAAGQLKQAGLTQ